MISITEEQYNLISDSLRENAKGIVLTIGCEKAFDLFHAFGGVEVTLSQKQKEMNRMIALCIGDDAYDRLTNYLGMGRVYIPNCSIALSRLKEIKIIDEYFKRLQGGVSGAVARAEICRMFGICNRNFYKILARSRLRKTALQ